MCACVCVCVCVCCVRACVCVCVCVCVRLPWHDVPQPSLQHNRELLHSESLRQLYSGVSHESVSSVSSSIAGHREPVRGHMNYRIEGHFRLVFFVTESPKTKINT